MRPGSRRVTPVASRDWGSPTASPSTRTNGSSRPTTSARWWSATATNLRRTFHRAPEYYRSNRPEDEPLDWYQYSIEGTRRFRALKLWMSWQHLGTEGLGALVAYTIDLAEALADRLDAASDFELSTPPDLSVVCFRHLPGAVAGWPEERVDRYQAALQRALEVDGSGWVSVTALRGRTCLRAGVVNYLATVEDVDRLVATLRACSEGVLEDLDRG